MTAPSKKGFSPTMPSKSLTIRDDIPTVILPLDFPTRELDSKLVLAAAVAQKGCRSVVGRKAAMMRVVRDSGPVVWQGKDIFAHNPRSKKQKTAEHLSKTGSGIVYIQDEGGIFQTSSWKEQVIDRHFLAEMRNTGVSRLCAWGRLQREVMADYAPELEERVRVTGSPRFDLYGPRFEWMARDLVDGLKDRFGPYFLVCTRFRSIAHAEGPDYFFKQKLGEAAVSHSESVEQLMSIWFTRWRQDVHDFAEFVILIKELAHARPDRTLILRPHPSESMTFYEQAFKLIDNVKIIREGTVLPWIRGADLVVHSNCTTGIEAVLAGCPVVSFLPGDVDRSQLNMEVACEAGVRTGSVSEALATIDSLLAGARPPQIWSERARSVLNNIEEEAVPLLVDETVRVAEEKGIESSHLVLPGEEKPNPWIRFWAKRRSEEEAAAASDPRGVGIEEAYVSMILDGCAAAGVGQGRIGTLHPDYVVVEP